jgi:glutathione reductase (NADPH)
LLPVPTGCASSNGADLVAQSEDLNAIMSDHDVDLFVIGGGSGGVRAARIAAQHGARVMVAEEYRVGGTCVIRGCVPKKLLVYASRFRAEFEDAAGYGWDVSHAAFDWPTLIANKDKEIARLEAAYTATLNKAGVSISKNRAVLADANTVQLSDGERVRAAYVLIATGGAPSYGNPIPGIEHAISSNEAFNWPKLPAHVVIQGGGYIALEFAGIFAGLGSHVTLVYRGENILRGFDDDVRQHVRMDMEKRGIRVLTGCKIAAIERNAARFSVHLSSGNQLAADCVMFATGRQPNVAGMGLKEAGVEIGKNGGVAVDPYSRTSVSNIYAIGDVTNRLNLTPVAIREGSAFADTVFGGKPTAVDHTNVPTAVFSDPEVGVVGLTETEARARLARTDVYRAMFKPLKAALSGRDTTVLVKLVVDGLTDRMVGCHVVGEGAADMAQLAAIAVKAGATKADFDATMALHPTTAEELVTLRQKSASYAREAAE